MNSDRSLSDFWRDRSDDRVLELISVLRGSDNLIGLMGSDLKVTWSGSDVSYTDFQRRMVALDYGPLAGERTPYPGGQVDEVIGYAAHEGGHCIYTEPGKGVNLAREINGRWSSLPTALKRAWRAGERNKVPDGDGGMVNPVLGELCRIQNILEDAYVDYHVADRWEVLGEHIRVSRQKLNERRPIDLDALARRARPDRNAVLNLWIALSLYDYDLPPRMSVRVRRALTSLLTLTHQAIGTHDGMARHHLAVDAATILFQEFPTEEAPLPTLPQSGQGQGASPQGGSSPGAPSGASSAGRDDQPDQDGNTGGDGGDTSGDDGDEQDDSAYGNEQSNQDSPDDDGDGDNAAGDTQDTDTGQDAKAEAIRRLMEALKGEIERKEGQWSDTGEAGEPDEQGGDGAGHVGNLDDFDDREVVEVPQELLDAIAEAIAHELEDLSQSVAEVLAEDPRQVAASARKADEDPERARRVTSQVMPQVQEIRRLFDRQQDTLTRHLTGLERGKVDSRRLARVGAGDLNVFRRKQVLETPDMAVGLLLDVSGSMNAWMHVVEQTAAVFAEGLIHKPGINFAAWAYTGDYANVELTRLCDRKMGKLHLANVTQCGGTPSGAAIAGVQVLMARMPERKKLLLHFTDGSPDNAQHVHIAVKAAREAGIRVYAIGAGRMGSSLESQYGHDNWECIDRVDQLPRAMANIIKRLG